MTATYPGASAVAVEQSVATPIEQEVNGVDRMIYMQSSNTSDGRMLLDVNFQVGVDQDTANVLTQNRVASAQARLPQEVNAQGVTVKKQSPSILMLVSVYSPKGSYDANYLINYCGINLRDQLLRIPGIAQVDLFGGTDYGMRIWLRPDKLAKLGLTPADVISAIKEQNLQAPAGRIGAAPSPKDQQFTYTVAAPSRLVTAEQFEDIIIRSTEGAAEVRIRDVGRADLGSQDYNSFGRLDGKPAGSMAVYLLPGADQLKAAHAVYETMARAKGLFPPDMDYKIVYDTTPAVEASIHEIVKTFVEALILVTLVVFIFLAERAGDHHPAPHRPRLDHRHLHLLPDARVLGEHALHVRPGPRHRHRGRRRHRRGRGRDAPHRARHVPARRDRPGDEGGVRPGHRHRPDPVGGVHPRGLRGRAHRPYVPAVRPDHRHLGPALGLQRAVALAGARGDVPQACPWPGGATAGLSRVFNWIYDHTFGIFFRGFNWVFDKTTTGYVSVARLLVRRAVLTILIVAAVAVGAGLFGRALPAGFIPDEDQALLGVNVQLPPGASLERTAAVLTEVEGIVAKTPGVDAFTTIGGYGVVTNTYQPNFGTIFARLKPWEERHDSRASREGSHGRDRAAGVHDPGGDHLPVQHPDHLGLRRRRPASSSSSRTGAARSRSSSSAPRRGASSQAARQRPELASLFTSFDPNYPQVKVELDRAKARSLGVPINDVFQAMSAALGGAYVNDFNRFGRLYRVYVQAEADYRRKPQDIGEIFVRSKTTGTMIPLSTLVSITSVPGTEITTRFNLFRSVEVSGAPARGYTSGQALAALEEVFAATMPKEMGFAYSSLSYQEKTAPPAAPTFILAIVFVFLLLAAMYESWRLPWAVLLGSPLVALGAFLGVWLMGYDNNVYVQIGLIMLVGLAAKNAILIVEFAKAKHEEGQSVEDAALESARLRFRPILMTAFAFILGVVPLMLAKGRGRGGAERHGHGRVLGHAGRHRARRVHHPRQLRLRGGARTLPQEARAGVAPASRARADRRRGPLVRRALALAAAGLVMAGCTVGPDYQRPESTRASRVPRSRAGEPARSRFARGPAVVGDLRRPGAAGPHPGGVAPELRPARGGGAHPRGARAGHDRPVLPVPGA